MRSLSESQMNGMLRYNLEELAVLEGVVAEGCGFSSMGENSHSENEKQPLFIVYLHGEEEAFIQGKNWLTKKFDTKEHPFLYDVQWLEVHIREDISQQQNNQRRINDVTKIPRQAQIVSQQVLKSLLQAKHKKILFLISVGQYYHHGTYLQAVVNLFEILIKGCWELSKDDVTAIDAKQMKGDALKSLNESLHGNWQILAVAADSLQVHNHCESAEEKAIAEISYIIKGERWINEAHSVFKKLTSIHEKINVKVKLVGWDTILNEANTEKFNFHQKYLYLFNLYMNPSYRMGEQSFRASVNRKIFRYINNRKPEESIVLANKLDIAKNTKNPDSIDTENKQTDVNSPNAFVNQDLHDENLDYRLTGFSDTTKQQYVLGQAKQLVKNLFFKPDKYRKKIKSSFQGNRFNMPVLNEHTAVPRNELLSKLKEFLNESPCLNQKIVVCYGMGGVGKSHLAYYYSNHSEYEYTLVIRLDGSGAKAFENNLRELAVHLKIIDKNSKDKAGGLKKLCSWLSQEENAKFLMIIEDVRNIYDIKEHFPRIGHFIITTRNKNLVDNGIMHLLPVDVMSDPQAIRLLQHVSKRTNENDEQFKFLANKLSNHPLALLMAGGFLLSNPEVTVENYLNQYNSKFCDLLRHRALISGNLNNNAVTVTFEISIRQIFGDDQKNRRVSLVEELLQIFACLHRQNIPAVIIENWLANYHANNLSLESNIQIRLIQQLEMHSLIKYDSQKGYISIHGILQDAVNDKMKKSAISREKSADLNLLSSTDVHFLKIEQDLFLQYIIKTMNILLSSFPYEEKFDHHCELKRILLPHIEKVLDSLDKYCKMLMKKGMMLENAQLIKLKSELILKAMIYLADVYNDIGDFVREVELLKIALVLVQKYYGQNNLLFAKTAFSLGRSYNILGNYQQAQFLIDMAFSIRQNFYGISNIKTQAVELSRKVVLYNLGELSQHKFIAELYNKLIVKGYPNECPIFYTYWSRSAQFTETSDGKLSYTDEHHSWLDLVNLSENARKKAGEIKQQNKVYNKTVLAFMLLDLGKLYRITREHLLYRGVSEQALKLLIEEYGSNHIYVVFALYNLALAEGKVSGLQKKKEVLELALNISQLNYDKNPLYFAIVLYRLSKVNLKLKNFDIGIQQLQRVLSILNYKYYSYNEIIDNVLYQLSSAYLENKDYLRAEELLIKIINERHVLYGVADARLHIMMFILAKLYQETGKLKDSKILMVRYLEFAVTFNTCSVPDRYYYIYNLHNKYHYMTESTKNLMLCAQYHLNYLGFLIMRNMQDVKHKIVIDYFKLTESDEKEIDSDKVITEYMQSCTNLEHELNQSKERPLIARLLYKGIFNNHTQESSGEIIQLVSSSDEPDVTAEDLAGEPAVSQCQLI